MNVPLFQAPPKRTAAMRDAESLFDFLADRPEGVTIQEISDHIGKETSGARKAVRTLRLLLGAGGDGDTINVVCEQPRPAGGLHLYRLVGNLDEAREWTVGRVNHVESQVRTVEAVIASIAQGADKRTSAGKKAHRMHVQLSRLVEDLDELAAGG